MTCTDCNGEDPKCLRCDGTGCLCDTCGESVLACECEDERDWEPATEVQDH